MKKYFGILVLGLAVLSFSGCGEALSQDEKQAREAYKSLPKDIKELEKIRATPFGSDINLEDKKNQSKHDLCVKHKDSLEKLKYGQNDKKFGDQYRNIYINCQQIVSDARRKKENSHETTMGYPKWQ